MSAKAPRRGTARNGRFAAIVALSVGCSTACKPEFGHPYTTTSPVSAAPASLKMPEPDPDPAPPRCAIASPKATMELLVAAGPQKLAVTLAGAEITVVPSEGHSSAVTVTGALDFVGHAEDLEFFPWTPVVVASGVVELGPMSVLGPSSTNGADVIAESIDVGGGFQLGEVSVPCAALTFVGAGHGSEEAHRRRGPRLRTASCAQSCATFRTPETLEFHALPDDDARVRLTGSTLVSELERRGDWSRVATLDYVHMDGAQLTGWVRNAPLEEIKGSVSFTGGRGLGKPRARTRHTRRAIGADVYQGPARIDADTAVYSAADNGHRWATVRDGAAEFEVVIRPGATRARILRAPHVTHLQSAWVRVEAVHPIRT